jgi:hypothetical protein
LVIQELMPMLFWQQNMEYAIQPTVNQSIIQLNLPKSLSNVINYFLCGMQRSRAADVTCLPSEYIDRQLPMICEFMIVVIKLICLQENFASPV